MKEYLYDKHVQYILDLGKKTESFEYYITEHLRMSGVYWGLAAMETLDASNKMKIDELIEFALSCQNEDGGFGGNVDHDSHLLYTLSAVQILAICDALDK